MNDGSLLPQDPENNQEAVKLSREGKDASDIWLQYKKIRNHVNNRRKFEEKSYKVEKMETSLDSVTDTWRVAKSFMGWDSDAGPPSQLCINGALLTKSIDIANATNQYFVDKISKIRHGINYVPNTYSHCTTIMKNKQCSLSLQHVSIKQVTKYLKRLKTSRSTSIDTLDNYCVKAAAGSIAPRDYIITAPE